MQLEQNIFNFHKTFLKIPRIIFYILIITILAIIAYQTSIVIQTNTIIQSNNYSNIFFKYYKQTHKPNQPIQNQGKPISNEQKSTVKVNQQINQNQQNQLPKQINTNQETQKNTKKQSNQVPIQQFVNQTTYIQVYFNQTQQSSYNLQPSPPTDIADLYIFNTHQLIYMNKSGQFQKQHKIIHHALLLKSIQKPYHIIGNPLTYNNQIVYQIITKSFKDLWQKVIGSTILKNNIQNIVKYFLDNKSETKILYVTQQQYIQKISQLSENKIGLISKLIYLCIALFNLVIVSIFMGLFVRYSIISFITMYLGCGGYGTNFNWLSQYTSVIPNSFRNRCCLTIWVGVGMFAMYLLLAIGSWWGITILLNPFLTFLLCTSEYSMLFIKNIFFVELCHFLFMHTRTTLYFYPRISTIITLFILYIIHLKPFFHTSYFLNLHLLLEIIIVIVMILIQSTIINAPYHSEYKPSFEKPRMIFYMGYQLSWEKSIPPVWTYFTNWFDWSYVSQKQRVYIDGDYRLLYGMMMGVYERHELPQQQGHQQDISDLRQ